MCIPLLTLFLKYTCRSIPVYILLFIMTYILLFIMTIIDIFIYATFWHRHTKNVCWIEWCYSSEVVLCNGIMLSIYSFANIIPQIYPSIMLSIIAYNLHKRYINFCNTLGRWHTNNICWIQWHLSSEVVLL